MRGARKTRGVYTGIAAALALAVAACGGEAAADGSAAGSVEMATASDLSDAEVVVYKSPT